MLPKLVYLTSLALVSGAVLKNCDPQRIGSNCGIPKTYFKPLIVNNTTPTTLELLDPRGSLIDSDAPTDEKCSVRYVFMTPLPVSPPLFLQILTLGAGISCEDVAEIALDEEILSCTDLFKPLFSNVGGVVLKFDFWNTKQRFDIQASYEVIPKSHSCLNRGLPTGDPLKPCVCSSGYLGLFCAVFKWNRTPQSKTPQQKRFSSFCTSSRLKTAPKPSSFSWSILELTWIAKTTLKASKSTAKRSLVTRSLTSTVPLAAPATRWS
ncbi:hypothetical protein L596_025400 [Steinernema carpocapsae]|uniref:EGF-like domain-containing protein n=1 Tax=Steinernema carpocapsae TaxID=34508 RepID=A0A4U5M7N9_STECR|nr:hypothetical protein L596_025400 [Steinernema carpocapsae]